MTTALAVMDKPCTHCGIPKPRSDAFYNRKRQTTKAGRLQWDSWCRKCKAQSSAEERRRRRTAEYKLRAGQRLTPAEETYARMAERARELNREYLAREREKPGWREEHNAKTREYRQKNKEIVYEYRRFKWRDQNGERQLAPAKKRTRYVRKLSKSEKFPIEPFAQWLEKEFGRYTPPSDFAWKIGLSEREIFFIRNRERPTVTIRIVDKALVTFGRPDILNDLYPLESA